ncbi:MAG: hypothetical protein CMB56_003800 [Methanobacteriota archaeon]|nr:MAG: hypothetical protein CMB56_003800 [Euryarchaeota archaeon]|tara:strand:- start:10517 stop:11623 length:1107 start_codon:yes stop_codon:yes gene_type:complete
MPKQGSNSNTKPRERGIRSINQNLIGSKKGDGRHSPPVKYGDKWLVSGSLGSRLWNKSAIGLTIEEGCLLTPEEVLFCHWHRHLPLPEMDWLKNILIDDKFILHRAAVMNTIREPGDLIIISNNDKFQFHPESWGLRWNRGDHPARNGPISEVKWVINSSEINWEELFRWTIAVEESGRCSEVLVVDEEFDVTAYRLKISHPLGKLKKPSELKDYDFEILKDGFEKMIESGEGYWLPINHKVMPLPQLGIPQASGIWLAEIDRRWLEKRFKSITSTQIDLIYENLLERGLWARPGFKYGCRWRVYSEDITTQHAPWLIVPDSEAPKNWNQACLAARLAAGVNKSWICALIVDGEVSFIQLERWSPGKA